MILTMTLHALLLVMYCAIRVPKTVILQNSTFGPGVYDSCFYLAMCVVVTRLLLLLAGDVEQNPGPISPEQLTNGLAVLITEAPATVKPVLGVWGS